MDFTRREEQIVSQEARRVLTRIAEKGVDAFTEVLEIIKEAKGHHSILAQKITQSLSRANV